MKSSVKKHLSLLIAVIFLIGMMPAAVLGAGTEKVRVHLIGDSTVCNYSIGQYPRWGWGQALRSVSNGNATIINKAVSGASSRTFVEGANKYWSNTINDIRAGDYLFIQFGHNDQKTSAGYENVHASLISDEGDPAYGTSYYYYMRKFISETKAKGANPILVTSVERGTSYNSSTGKFDKNTLGGYPAATKELAAESEIPVVDLQQLSMDYFNTLDYNTVKKLYMNLDPGEYSNYPDGNTDMTHFTAAGATAMANLVMGDLERQGHVLADYWMPEGYVPEYYLDEDFEWGEESAYNTHQVENAYGETMEGRTLVYKAGTAVHQIQDRYNSNFHTHTLTPSDNTANFTKFALKTSIVQDEDAAHGQVLKFETNSTSWSGRRGISFYKPAPTDPNEQFSVLDFDFKFDKDTLLNQTTVYIEFAGSYLTLHYDKITFMSISKVITTSETLTTGAMSKYASEVSDTGTLAADVWYNVKLLYDMVNYQYDLFINDVMIAQDVDFGLIESSYGNWVDRNAETKEIKRTTVAGYPTIGMTYAYEAGTKAIYLDNVRQYQLTDDEAVDIAAEGLNNFIGDPLYTADRTAKKFTNKRMGLPFGNLTGYGYYASSTSKILDNGVHTPHISYAWSIPEESDFEIDRTTFKWGNPNPPYTFEFSGSDSATLVKAFTHTKIDNANLGTSDIVYDSANSLPLTGDVYDISFPLSVVVTKGTGTRTLNWNITLQRPLVGNSPLEGLEIGVPNSSTYPRIQDGLREFYFGTIVENNSGAACTYMPIIAVYDTSGSLITTSVLSVTLEDGAITPAGYVKRWLKLETEEEAAAAYAKCFLWVGGSYQPVTEVIPLTWK